VLLVGETGVGKEHLARVIHRQSPRAHRPFLPLDCSALCPSLLESELFGHEKGAFTGAHCRKLGILEKAQGGTLFLDEVGNIELSLQPKLLRVLEERQFRRVGGTEEISVDFRLLSATNRDLKKMIEEGSFREDLYYRLTGVEIYLPPLRERREDILPLVEYYLGKYNKKYQKDLSLSDGAREFLLSYSWPGNVREVMHVLEVLVIATEGEVILPQQIPLEVQRGAIIEKAVGEEFLSLRSLEKEYIRKVLKSVDYRIKPAARILGISKNTLKNKMRRYGIEKAEGL
jgi:transcriptional regulator with PAS, ATPase and Fis domain